MFWFKVILSAISCHWSSYRTLKITMREVEEDRIHNSSEAESHADVGEGMLVTLESEKSGGKKYKIAQNMKSSSLSWSHLLYLWIQVCCPVKRRVSLRFISCATMKPFFFFFLHLHHLWWKRNSSWCQASSVKHQHQRKTTFRKWRNHEILYLSKKEKLSFISVSLSASHLHEYLWFRTPF